MRKIINYFRFAAVVAMSVSTGLYCCALENDHPDITATFTPNKTSKSFVGNNITINDGVQCDISNAPDDIYYTNEGVEFSAGTIFTIKSGTFKNIMGVRVYFSGISANDNFVKIVSAEGSGFTEISELNDKRTNQVKNNSTVFYFMEPLVLLSEIKLEMLPGNYRLDKIEVMLNVEPDFLVQDGDTIYGDDPIPFIKRTNSMTYRYGIDVEYPEDIEILIPMTENEIKLTGYSKGEHMVFLDVDDTKTTNAKRSLKSVTINYDPEKPNDNDTTTAIESVINEEAPVYYDLTGRSITPKSKLLLIRKTGSTSKLIRY